MQIKKIGELTEDELCERMDALYLLFGLEKYHEDLNFMWDQWHVLADALYDLRVKRGNLRLRMTSF